MNPLHQPDVQAVMAAFGQGRYADAAALAQRMAGADPRSGFAWNALGNALARLGRLAEAVAAFQRAAQRLTGDADLYSNLGLALFRLGRLDEAQAALRQALQIRPADPAVLDTLGLVLQGLHRLDEALSCHEAALRLAPEFAEAYNHLGIALRAAGEAQRAEAQFRRAIAIRPHLAEAHNNLGALLHEAQRSSEAEPCLRRALEIQPDYASALGNLGAALLSLGRSAEGEACLRRALQLHPDDTNVRSSLIFHRNYADQDGARYLDEAREYGRIVAARASGRYTSWRAAPPPPLRVGLVSGDLREHPVGYFLESALSHLDPGRIQVYAYPTTTARDARTARIETLCAAWQPLARLSDAQAAQRIHGDGLHILLDLAGHTSGNRLPLFAWKPAPVQASWLGYFASTGVAQIDYLLADRHGLPPESARRYTERIAYLPETRLCFTRPPLELPVGGLPAAAQGFVTFCCCNNLLKMTDPVVAAWSRLLAQLPDARLLLKAGQLADDAQRRRVRERYAAHGVDAERITLEGPSGRADYFAALGRADIALDPFPYSGATTTMEALWMGVPVLTLAGDRLVARQGVALLRNAGLDDWIAADVDDYVARAVAHARDAAALATLRAGLRQRLLASPLMDAARFAGHLTQALYDMWGRYAAS